MKLASILLIAAAAIASAEPTQTGYFRGTALRINSQGGIFAQSAKPTPIVASRSASVGGGGNIYDPNAGKKFTTQGIPETIYLTGHPGGIAERDQITAEVEYTGVTSYDDQYGEHRTIHTYRITRVDAGTPAAQRPATPQRQQYRNPLDKKPSR